MKHFMLTLAALAFVFGAPVQAGEKKPCQECCGDKCQQCCQGDCGSCCAQ